MTAFALQPACATQRHCLVPRWTFQLFVAYHHLPSYCSPHGFVPIPMPSTPRYGCTLAAFCIPHTRSARTSCSSSLVVACRLTTFIPHNVLVGPPPCWPAQQFCHHHHRWRLPPAVAWFAFPFAHTAVIPLTPFGALGRWFIVTPFTFTGFKHAGLFLTPLPAQHWTFTRTTLRFVFWPLFNVRALSFPTHRPNCHLPLPLLGSWTLLP